MARIKLLFPENNLFTVKVPVRITDVNYGNHVGNDALVSIIHECRVQWLAQHGFTELEIEGTGLIMSDLAVEYLGESFYGDVFEIELAAGEISQVGFELYYRVSTTRNGIPVLIARAKTGMICFDYGQKKVVKLPVPLKEILAV